MYNTKQNEEYSLSGLLLISILQRGTTILLGKVIAAC